jgi:hypothetical protein
MGLGALLIAAPGLGNIGSASLYDQAFAEKGGNGKGGGGANSNNGGDRSAGKNGGSPNATTNFASNQTGNQKQLALTDPSHPSMLGRWNSAKPLDHPAIQAHIRNGNFQGTIGMIAAYVYAEAQAVLGTDESTSVDLAAAEANMEANSNRGLWSEIREAVREKMGLQTEESEPAPATEATTETAP